MIPCDVFSTCRSMAEALASRQQFGAAGDGRWHGDT